MNRREFIVSLASVATFPSFGLRSSEDPNNLVDKLIAFSKTCKIPTANGVEYFNPRPYQIEYFKRLVNSSKLICKKCRQCGATTMNLIYAHWKLSTYKNYQVVVVLPCYSTSAAHNFQHMFESIYTSKHKTNGISFVSCI